MPQLLTAQTALAELDVLSHEGNLLDVVSGSLRALCKLFGKHVAVRATSQAR